MSKNKVYAMFQNRQTPSRSIDVGRNQIKKEDMEDIKPQMQKGVKRKRPSIGKEEYHYMPMCGIKVALPPGLTPYPTQKLMMVRILTSLKNRLNVLAESPTGSGKTMALLASTCAWLSHYKEERAANNGNCPVHAINYGLRTDDDSMIENKTIIEAKIEDVENTIVETPKGKVEKEWEDDFTVVEDNDEIPNAISSVSRQASVKEEDAKKSACTCLPRVRVYYGTRTHKQLSQVVNEFARLPYAGVIRHTILASREQSCINQAARKSPDISGFCKEINSSEGVGCSYKTAMKQRFERPQPLRFFIEKRTDPIFDMEDLVEALSSARPALCPYFCSNRVLTIDADIIFCPFSYLVDPLIRESSDVHLKNSVVILDEAHNIEDTCREAASFTFTEKEIDDAMHNLYLKKELLMASITDSKESVFSEAHDHMERFAMMNQMLDNLKELENLTKDMANWLRYHAKHAMQKPLTRDDKYSLTMSWAILEHSMQNKDIGLSLYSPEGSPKYNSLMEAFKAVASRSEGENVWIDVYKPSAQAIVCIEKWLYFQFFFSRPEYRQTYRGNALVEKVKPKYNNSSYVRRSGARNAGPKNTRYVDDDDFDGRDANPWLDETSNDDDTWMDSKKGASGKSPIAAGCKTSIHLWCMSPALAFKNAFADTRSVILASGTLCPMESLKTELGTDFKQQMEGSQVIDAANIFAAVLPLGPYGNKLKATYEHTSDARSHFYAEIGAVIKHVCTTVPNGVLCFLPSYRVLENLKTHLEQSSWMSEIESKKVIVYEPRRSSDLREAMDQFDDAILYPKRFGRDVDGALMFAVYRGKVSEGIDFADERARVVISVGIPFPNSVDEMVSVKRKYNDENHKILGILNGEEWYVTQAYRALNQALGRCLRHKNDWGAMILLDERLEKQANRTITGAASARLSKWIRAQLQVFPKFKEFSTELQAFFDRHMTVKKEVKMEVKTEVEDEFKDDEAPWGR